MDTSPHLLMRFIQLDTREKALSASTFWGCGACVTCSFRCPIEIDVLRVINTVRSIALEYVRIEPERFQTRWISASEAIKFVETVKEMTESIRKLGPNRKLVKDINDV